MNYAEVYREIEQGTAPERLPEMVLAELAAVTRGDRDLAAVRHPLGFVCLPLQRDGEFGVCVHAWDDEDALTGDPADPGSTGGTGGTGLTTSQMHSHSWDLVSFVLYGEVRNQLVRVADAPEEPTHQLCEVHSSGDADEIRPTGRAVRWTPGPAQSTSAGQTYRLDAGEFHMTVVPDRTRAATVVLGRGRGDAVDLSLGGLDIRTHRVSRQRCAHRETLLAASLVADRLADKMTKSGKRGG